MRGCLYQIAGLFVLGLAMIVLVLSWPVSAWLAGVLVILWLLGHRDNPWTKSARKVLQPVAWALSILTVLQLVYNASLPEEHTATIAEIEGYIADFSTAMPKWSTLSWWQVCIVLAIVMMLNVLRPQAKLVSKFLKGRKIISRVAAILAVLACFSFFAPETFRPQIAVTRAKIRARMIALEKETSAVKTRRVVLNAFRTTTEQLGDSQRAYLTAAFQVTTAISRQAHAARAVAPRLADSHWQAGAAVSGGANVLDFPPGVVQPVPNTIQTASFSTLRRHEKQLALQHAANAELEKGLKEMFAKSIGAATDSIRDIASDYIGALIDLESNELLHQVRRYFDAVGDAYFDKVKDPLVDKAVARVRTIWEKLGESKMAADEVLSVATQTKNAVANEAIALATAAKHEAAGISGRSDEEVIRVATKIEADAQRASELASVADDLIPESFLNANSPFAKGSTGLIMTDTAVIPKDLKAAKNAAKSAVAAAIAAKEAAAAVRAAKETAQAAKALKTLVKIIPK